MKYYIGLMSGTSMDGIDAALVDPTSQRLIAGITCPYSDRAQHALRQISFDMPVHFEAHNALNRLLGEEFAKATQQLLEKTEIHPEMIYAIGSHGQTVCHDVSGDTPYTLQLACPHTLSERTGIPVVADFRTRDLVLGGQGAPFAPLYHAELFQNLGNTVGIVNIGGIANISYRALDGAMCGYDTGPGNCLMDTWIRQHLNVAYDKNGDWANHGHVISELLDSLCDDPFFTNPLPKSIGTAYFDLAFLNQRIKSAHLAADVQATLLAFTARTIVEAVNELPTPIKYLAICGGGVHNAKLMSELQRRLPTISVRSTASWGIDPDYLEAMLFAWLAEKHVNQIPLDLTRITAAKKQAILGAFYPVYR